MRNFGRFSYTDDFSYKYSNSSNVKPIFGWVTVDGHVYNCEERDGLAVKGEVEFTNIDGFTVRQSYGSPVNFDSVFCINWWDCRIDATKNSCI